MIILVGAPMHGWVGPLDEVPDPVFAERMMGDGVAIDPFDGVVLAPCAARVLAVAATRHSVTLELANGAQLLIHVGLETVALGGDGFTAHITVDTVVAAGDPLLSVDLDLVAQRAKSLITPMVVVNDGFTVARIGGDGRVAARDALFEVRAMGAAAVAGPAAAQVVGELVVGLPNGIHARPAARIVAALRPFEAMVSIAAHGRIADARSIVGLLSLGVGSGDRIAFGGAGSDAAAAIAALVTLIETGMVEAGAAEAPHAVPAAVAHPSADGALLHGICASPGIATGAVAHLHVADIAVPAGVGSLAEETRQLDTALAALAAQLDARSRGAGGEIFAAHRDLLRDPALVDAARGAVASGHNAGTAWRTATASAAIELRAAGDPRIAERVADLVDLERQLLALLYGAPPVAAVPAGAILIAAELLPSQFLTLDAAQLAGICLGGGGPTSHVAILAASAGVPMLVAAGPAVLAVPEGRAVVLDAGAGTLDTAPGSVELAAAARLIAATQAGRAAEAAAAHFPCTTADGTRIEVFANLASVADAETAAAYGAEGCGLLRTEFLFEGRAAPPSEAEQRETYAGIAAALGDRPLIVRTLDSGGDKPVAWLPAQREDNPALGVRGIRLGLARPELLAVQLRAILGGVPAAQCRIMLPMIVDVAEFRRVRDILDVARAATASSPVALGVMIETPAAALLADSLAAEADFLSIGSNDLTQYALAADRGNPALAAMIDPLHPAVLRLIAHAADGARRHGRWLGVCGGVASDPAAAAILIGLGVTELSATPAAVPAVKAAVRRLRIDDCRALAARALAADIAPTVRALIAEFDR